MSSGIYCDVVVKQWVGHLHSLCICPPGMRFLSDEEPLPLQMILDSQLLSVPASVAIGQGWWELYCNTGRDSKHLRWSALTYYCLVIKFHEIIYYPLGSSPPISIYILQSDNKGVLHVSHLKKDILQISSNELDWCLPIACANIWYP